MEHDPRSQPTAGPGVSPEHGADRENPEAEGKGLESALKESQRRYQALLETTGEFIWETDASGKYTYCSPQMRSLWGFEPEQRLGTTPFDVMPPEDREPALQFFRAMVDQPQPFRMETRAYNAAGEVIFLETSGIPFFDEKGGLQGYRGTSRDITDRRKAEDALRESEARAQALIRYAPTAIYELDYRGSRFINVNDAVCIVSGYSREEILSMNPMDLLADESRDLFADRIRRQLAGEKIADTVEYKVRKKDGSLMCVTLNVSFPPRPHHTALVIAHDITERRRMEEALEEASRNFRGLFNNRTVGVACCQTIVDDQGQAADYLVLDVNDTYQELTGVSRERIVGKRITEALPGVARALIDRHNRVALTGYDDHFETFEPVTGRWYDVNVYSPRKGYFTTIVNNTTSRKQAEEKMGRQSAIREAIHRVLRDTIGSATEEDLGDACLSVVQELTGSRLGFLGEVNDRWLIDYIAVSDPGWSPGHVRVLPRGYYTNDPASHPDVTGTPPGQAKLTAFLGVPLLNDGRVMGMIGLANREGGYRPEDLEAAEAMAPVIVEALIRERAEIALRENEARLRLSEQRYRALFESISDGFCVIEKVSTAPGEPSDFKYVAGNQAYQQITGICTPVGRTIRQAFPLVPQQVFDGYDRLIETGSPFRFESNRAIEGRIFENHAFLIPDGKGRRIGVMIRDVTERRKAEEDLRRYADQLEAANKDMESFSYSLSHDLRAPLRTMDGFSEAVLADYGDKLDQAGTDHLRRIRRASRTMSDLIDGMLKLSQIGRAELKRERVDLRGIARSICDELRAAQPERRIEVALAGETVVHGDRQLLGMLLRNLLENAWKFTGKSEAARIEFGITLVGGERAYFVKDNGVGFDMKHAGKLFDPFRRLHSSKEFPGTGIGLATARRIVRSHGGRIWAESEPGRGATFYFVLGS